MLSFNPLTEKSVENVLDKPKTLRILNLVDMGVTTVPVLEMPFLMHLNLSHLNLK